MSKQAESWVWDHSQTNGNDRIVLLFLADQGDDDGTNSFPSMRRIAEKCHVNVDTVSRVLVRLEAAGEVLVERPETQGRGHFNRYTLVLGRPIAEVEALRDKGRDTRPFRGPSKSQGKEAKSSGTRGPDPRLPTDPQTPSGFNPVSEERPAMETSLAAEARSQFEEHFWPVYPARDGKRQGKAAALRIWVRLPIEDRRAAVRGARHYAASGWRPKDAERWLRDCCWKDWQEPALITGRDNGRPSPAAGIMAQLRQEATS